LVAQTVRRYRRARKETRRCGLAYIQVLEGESKSALTKSFGAEGVNAVIAAAGAKAGDAILMIGGKWDVVCNASAKLRLESGPPRKIDQ